MTRLWIFAIVLCSCSVRPALEPLEPLMATPNQPFRQTPPPPRAPKPPAPPGFERHRLDNGLSVFIAPTDARFVATVLVSRRAGSDEPPALAGQAAMLTSALMKPLEGLGATEEIVPDAGIVSLVGFAGELDATLAALAEPITQPSVDPEVVRQIAAHRAAVLRDEAFLVTAQQQARRWIFGPARGLALDTDRLIANALRFDAEAAAQAHRRMFVPADCAVIVVGPVRPAEVLERVTRHFGGWQASAPAPQPPARPAPGRPAEVHYRHAATGQAVVTLAFPAPPRTAPDHDAVRVMTAIYGSLFMSRLNQGLREQDAHTYGAHAHYWAGRRDGMILTSTAIKNEQLLPSLDRLRAITASMSETPPSALELEAAKATLVEKLRRSRETTAGLATAIAELYIYDLPASSWLASERAISAVDAGDVRDAVTRYLSRPAPIVVAGDSGIRAQLARSSFDVVYGPDAQRAR